MIEKYMVIRVEFGDGVISQPCFEIVIKDIESVEAAQMELNECRLMQFFSKFIVQSYWDYLE